MKTPNIEGVEVREEDLDRKAGLHIAAIVIRISSIVILLLALWQFYAWFQDRPPGGAGLGLLVGDTIRLIVFAALLWAASDLAELWIKTHYDQRAARILLARQTYMIRQWGLAAGMIPMQEAPEAERRGVEPEATIDPGSAG